ncbi:MAG: prepilin-type N-terminal cleavage/methylation domain-containing protein [Planctomycetia bacterium]|nr:prepilin-type N-terminal cleavage/methylation domain-containing protein [Planctomycetia bacterium]
MVERRNLQNHFRSGFTLIELLVVLGIITALSGLALSYVDNLNTSHRKDRTTQRLDELETLLHGDGQNPGTFLADMGRLPIARELNNTNGLEEDVCATDSVTGWIMPSGKLLSELWDGGIFKFPYAIPGDATLRVPRPFLYYRGYEGDILSFLTEVNSDASVTIGDWDCPKITLECGWKGPYLNVQPGKNYYDGFGNDFRVNVDTGSGEMADLLWPRDTILEVGSFGENAEADKDYWLENPTEEEVEWQHRDDLRKMSETRIFATLVVRILVRNYSGGQMTWVSPQFFEESFVPEYDATTTYTDADVVRSADSETGREGDLFRIVRSGMTTAGGTLKRGNAFIDDRGQEWQWTPCTRQFTHLRAAVFSPAVEEKPRIIENEDKKYTGMRVTTAQFAKWTETSGGVTVTRNEWGIGDSVAVPGEVVHRSDFFAWTVPPNHASGDLTLLYEEPSTREVDGQDYPQHSPEPIAEGGTPGEVCFTRLTPGVRKLFVYGYLFNDLDSDGVKDAGEPYSQAVHSGIQTIELRPGVNFVTVYLSENLEEFLP